MRKVLIKTANKQDKTMVKELNDNGRGKQMSIVAKKVMSYKDIRMNADIQASNLKTSQSIKIAKISRTI